MATDFYRTLFQQELPAPRTRRCREEAWRHTPPIIQPSMQASLMAPFTTTEMQEALMAIDGQKCLGEDGLSRAFFTTFWDQIQQPLPKSLSSGLICLIPKGETDRSSVSGG